MVQFYDFAKKICSTLLTLSSICITNVISTQTPLQEAKQKPCNHAFLGSVALMVEFLDSLVS